MASEGATMGKAVRKDFKLRKPPLQISVRENITFDGNMMHTFAYMENCLKCGFAPLVWIKDENLDKVTRKYCSKCDVEWMR